MACLVEGVAAALSSSSGGGWRRDPLELSCLEQAMQVNIFTIKTEKGSQTYEARKSENGKKW